MFRFRRSRGEQHPRKTMLAYHKSLEILIVAVVENETYHDRGS